MEANVKETMSLIGWIVIRLMAVVAAVLIVRYIGPEFISIGMI